jgi:addiction module RelE/StbE family toxin
MKIVYAKSYEKAFRKLPHPIQAKVIERVDIFRTEPFYELLHNHPLTGEYTWYRSINITGDYRAIFEELSDGTYEFVEFLEVGTHSQLYN